MKKATKKAPAKRAVKSKDELRQELSQKKMQKVSGLIATILEDHNMALHPMLGMSQTGIIPQVRLVETNNDEDAITKTNKGKTGADKAKDGAV